MLSRISFFSFAIILSSLSQAAEISATCDVVKLHDYEVFEESLAEAGASYVAEETGRLRIEAQNDSGEVNIGDSFFTSEEDTSQIKVFDNIKTQDVTIQNEAQSYKIILYKASQKGVLLFKSAEQNRPRYSTVAEIDCADYSKIKRAILKGQASESRVSIKKLSKELSEKISSIDVPFEMGDGYYDLKYEKLFQLSLNGQVVGYRLESALSYTEGDDTVASTYFLANGVRFAGPEN